jgi:hypothetical protein
MLRLAEPDRPIGRVCCLKIPVSTYESGAAAMHPEDLDDIRDFYLQQLGEVPPSIECALRTVPAELIGYMSLRRALQQRVDRHGLPARYASLVFAVLDIADRNYDGALNHSRAALHHGLNWDEFMHAVVQTWIVKGFAGSWGTVGWRVVTALEEEGHRPPEAAR